MADRIAIQFTARIPGGRLSYGEQAIESVAEELRKKGLLARGCARDVLNKYALKIQRTARKNLNRTPQRIDEGTLRTSVQIFVTQMAKIRLGALVFTDLEYAPYVHWGTGIHGENPEGGHRQTPWVYYDKKRKKYVFTRGMEANQFLVDAFNQHADAFLREFEACLKGL